MSTFPPSSLVTVAQSVVALLIKRKETITLVETASGGLISATLLGIPGTSRVFNGGINAYSRGVRKAFLNWTEEDDKSYDGPTIAIVRNLALALQNSIPSTYTLAESAVAGPTLHSAYRQGIKVGYLPISIVGSNQKIWWEGEEWVNSEIHGEGEKGRGGMMVEFARLCLERLEKVLLKREAEEKKAGIL